MSEQETTATERVSVTKTELEELEKARMRGPKATVAAELEQVEAGER